MTAPTPSGLRKSISLDACFFMGMPAIPAQVSRCSGASYCTNFANDLMAAILLLHVDGQQPLASSSHAAQLETAAGVRSPIPTSSAGTPASDANHVSRSAIASR